MQELNEAIKEIWKFIGRANKYIDETSPWILAKIPTKKNAYLQCSITWQALRVTSVHIGPIMPNTPLNCAQLGITEDSPPGIVSKNGKKPVGQGFPKRNYFPRIEEDKVDSAVRRIAKRKKSKSRSKE